MARRVAQLVAVTVIGARVKVARPARGSTVASELHVPKERLAQGYERGLISDVAGPLRRLRCDDTFERRDGALREKRRRPKHRQRCCEIDTDSMKR